MDYNSAVFLVSISDMKDYLDISNTSDDGRIGHLIEVVSREFDTECHRAFLEESHTEYRDGNGTSQLWLENAPVSAVTSIHVDSVRDFGGDTLVDSDNYFVDTDAGVVIRNTGHWPREHRNIKVVYTAGYTQANVPLDLRGAVYERVAQLWRRMVEKRVDITSRGDAAGENRSFITERFPPTVTEVLERYLRHG